jgi:hypothetical protein
MLDRYTARALVEAGQMSSEEYLRLFGEELRAARAQTRAEIEANKRAYATQARAAPASEQPVESASQSSDSKPAEQG